MALDIERVTHEARCPRIHNLFEASVTLLSVCLTVCIAFDGFYAVRAIFSYLPFSLAASFYLAHLAFVLKPLLSDNRGGGTALPYCSYTLIKYQY